MSATLTTDRLAELRADLATAGRVVPASWPLPSFVAANPLRAFESHPFEDACREARRWFGAVTHQPLARHRERADRGDISRDAIRWAVVSSDPMLTTVPPFASSGWPADRLVDPVDVVVDDLLHGPVPDVEPVERDGWTQGVIDHVGAWCAAYADPHPSSWAMPDRDRGLFVAWRSSAVHDRRLRDLVGKHGCRFVAGLPDEPLAAIATALDHLAIERDERIDALRSLLLTLPGWCGLARWVDEWAPSGGLQVDLHLVDLAAVLAAIEAARGGRTLSIPPEEVAHERDDATLLLRRVDSVAARLGIDDRAGRQWIHDVLARPTLPERAQLWLRAEEQQYASELLRRLERVDPGPVSARPAAQLVACIDVRSEILRRHVEAVGAYETFGFAGFFGFPIAWRPDGSPLVEARCPALVQPRHEIRELPADPVSQRRRRQRRSGLVGAEHAAKSDLGAPFAFAESSGWFVGLKAALRTFAPHRLAGRAGTDHTTSSLAIAAEATVDAGLTRAERALYAEAVVTTIGMRQFAPLIVLCGHASSSVNNPHASALDCGACGGAPGGVNARVAAAVLNDPLVRDDLAARGVEIPADTWFLAAEHDTTTDRVALFDTDRVPAELGASVDRLRADLDTASARTATERARRLPGDRSPDARSVDWAEVRPEWGLAGNAAFVIGPRSITKELDLAGQTFLHSYDATVDPDGTALETIMTAPLVVAQWISSQYYFSTVDPEVFGAGDKLVHNVVDGIGVLRGPSGDLAVGLPWQSVGVGDRIEHRPLRLLAAIQAPLEQIERIIDRNPVVRDLVANEWIRLAARSHGHEPWLVRSPSGTWSSRPEVTCSGGDPVPANREGA